MSILDDIIADVEIEMTEDLIRAFKIEGCDPACHCCEKMLEAGKMFKLAIIEVVSEWGHKQDPEDEMLCCDCTADMLIKRRKKEARERIKAHDRGGYTRKHKREMK